jgi:hypothetical protein
MKINCHDYRHQSNTLQYLTHILDNYHTWLFLEQGGIASNTYTPRLACDTSLTSVVKDDGNVTVCNTSPWSDRLYV